MQTGGVNDAFITAALLQDIAQGGANRPYDVEPMLYIRTNLFGDRLKFGNG